MNSEKNLSLGGLWMFGQFVDRYATDAYGPQSACWKQLTGLDKSVTW